MTDTECHGHISDLVCVGFGPAALALAIAFLEKKRAYIVCEVHSYTSYTLQSPSIRHEENRYP
ncbi:uncharacterized protein EI90DRAFT_3055127 [Cantharellus anzutake]|uniref:uncharacterized protein n=1 Tax=Cantharellus anzutake TaxID=1750568 RepID=UPI001907CCBC|nr:uncharacterized protein EI90DRAFT_3055127 [Cantharellus anzutake]KAF8332325.1 hypothetical protein EI90DRAFT_3055127 [Cantharellus anzutake]